MQVHTGGKVSEVIPSHHDQHSTPRPHFLIYMRSLFFLLLSEQRACGRSEPETELKKGGKSLEACSFSFCFCSLAHLTACKIKQQTTLCALSHWFCCAA